MFKIVTLFQVTSKTLYINDQLVILAFLAVGTKETWNSTVSFEGAHVYMCMSERETETVRHTD